MRALAVLGALLSLLLGQPAQAQVDMESLKHVDIRDLAENNTYMRLSSQRLIELMMQQPAKFVGPAVIGGLPNSSASTQVQFDALGARGPIGDIVLGNDGRNRFVPKPANDPNQIARSATREYTIFAAEYHDIIEEVVNQRFLIKLVLFIHDPDNVNMSAVSRGYFFRVFTVVIDWSKSGQDVIEIVSMDNEIPLTGTRFQLVGDILDRRVILEDSVYGIKKVFPLGVGAFNIRAGRSMDGHVSNMTREFQPGSKLHKVPAVDNPSGMTTRSRTYPSYFRGRPFFGIIAEDGEYKQIGMHYQIDDSLVRGFVSHGCIRTRDRDLYQLDAILNEGGQDYLPVRYHLSLAGDYARWQSPMKKEDSFYDSAVYSSRPSGESVTCKFDKYTVRRDRANPSVHTLADGDCLTMTTEVNRPTSEVIDYMLGKTDIRPVGLYSRGREHVPLALDLGDSNATEGWSSEGGREEVQRQRDAFLQAPVRCGFLGFKSRRCREREAQAQQQAQLAAQQAEYERLQAEYNRDQTIYQIPGDPSTARMTPIQPANLASVIPQVRMDLFAPAQQQVHQETERVTTPVVTAPVVTQPANNTTAIDPAEIKRLLEITEAEQNVSDVRGYIARYCNPQPTSGEYVQYCREWPGQLQRWQEYLEFKKRQ